MNVQVTASFTAEPIGAPFAFLLAALQSKSVVAFSPFNQVLPQLLNPGSEVRNAKGGHLFLVRARDLAPDDPKQGLKAFVDALKTEGAHLPGPVAVFFCPHADDDAEDALREAVAIRELQEAGHTAVGHHLLVDSLKEESPFDHEAQRAGQVPFTPTFFAALAIRALRQWVAWTIPPRKLIVVDADHTLWEGVIGEDGFEGITIEGPYAYLQEFLLKKREQGFLLALCSKNEAADTSRVLREHDRMLLREEHFVAQRVNWSPKSANIQAICQDLGLGLDSVVFIDDNPAETAEVAGALPMVYTVTLPQDRQAIRETLESCWAFDLGHAATREDRQRSEMYQAQATREVFRQRCDSFAKFLNELQLEVAIDPLKDSDRSRVAQLSTRTNQFNACKAPFQEAELIERQVAGALAFTVRASDRFGDYGLVGAMVAVAESDRLVVTDFFLSCRALGKGVERHMVRWLGGMAQERDLGRILIRFRQAERNGVCRQFLEEIGGSFDESQAAFVLPADAAAQLGRIPEQEWKAEAKAESSSAQHEEGGPLSGDPRLVEAQWSDPSALAAHLAAERSPRPALSEPAIPPASDLEHRLLELWESVLKLQGLGVEDRFTSLGGDSLQLVHMHARLLREFEADLPLTDLFELPTVRALAERLDLGKASSSRAPSISVEEAKRGGQREAIAIVGMALRTPGADSVESFWENLQEGKSSLHHFSDEELASAGVDVAAVRQDPGYVPVKGCLSGIDKFDAGFFGILPKEAKLMDPQHRLFLELAWETLERAGYEPGAYPGKIGVWAGAYLDTYVIANLCSDKAFHADWVPAIQVGSLQTELGNDKDYLATRVSFKLNLRGPSMTVQTACSTSMVAIAQAIQSLRAGESDMALAGGITITLPEKKGYHYTEDGMLSKDGRVCTFSDEATGTVFGNGAGIILLKRLSEAQRDGDHIHAVIRGAALNNDGGVKHSYTAPSVDGQVEVVNMAQRDAGVTADTITYIEAHGTGTPLGDPIEVAALSKCFSAQTDAKGFCTLGSLKPNVGHLDVASGVCGVIKTALALEHAKIPPLLHFQRANPKIDFENSPFKIETELKDWDVPSGVPRRAGVSSFGVGGTNGHVVLEEPPASQGSGESPRPAQLFLLSARSDTARERAQGRLAEFADTAPGISLADAAFTLATGRKAFAKRQVCVARSWSELQDKLARGKAPQGGPTGVVPNTVFMFPGQGAQHVGMAKEVLACEPVFREHVEQCADFLKDGLEGEDLREVLYPSCEDDAATDRLKRTVFAQPAIFVMETGLAKLWQSWGIEPHAMIGHSVGEFAAACIAGVFTLEEGLQILASRGRLMGDLPGGAMLSVRLSEEAIQPYLDPVDLAAVNGKELCVLAGSHENVAAVEARLEADGVVVKHLHTSHGFHSRMMDPVIEPFAAEIARASLKPPKIPIFSTVTESWLSDELAGDPDYWARHLRQPVRFYSSIRGMADTSEGQVFLEVGPGQTLATLSRQSVGRSGNHRFHASLAHAVGGASDYEQLLDSLGRLWMAGLNVDWPAYFAREKRKRVVLPPYPFERKRHWVEAQPILDPRLAQVPLPASEPTASAVISPLQSEPSSSPTSNEITMSQPSSPSSGPSRSKLLAAKMREILSELSDIPEEELAGEESFLELGFDSLLLTQVSKAFQDAFSASVTMRQLIDELPTIDVLVAHLDATLDPSIMAPEEAPAEAVPAPEAPSRAAVANGAAAPVSPAKAAPALNGAAPVGTAIPLAQAMPNGGLPLPPAPVAPLPPAPPAGPASGVGQVIQQQMELMKQQLALLQGTPAWETSTAPLAVPPAPPVASLTSQAVAPVPPAEPIGAPPRNGTAGKGATVSPPASQANGSANGNASSVAHGPYKPINRSKDQGLSEKQAQFIQALTERYNAKTASSKARTQQYRKCFADPRTANGFNRLWKEMCYQILVERAQGSRLLDIDGNEYIDIVNGFGPGFLGHSPDFVTEALHEQLDKTIAVGPQAELAGETAELVCQLIGADRVCFLNTGSEAVQAAMRLARTVTGRDRVVVFSKDYHGNFDEVLVKGANRKGKFKTLPIAPGIPRRAVEDVLVLEYGSEESLEIIRQQADQLAAVMVEPMQSRRPEFQPKGFIRELRKITEEKGCLFVFDEVITGFRTGPGGAQEYYGVKADLATYGKVIGGGMPVGLVAGKREYMDTFDGGHWQYGDDSFPEAPVTFFAGTFVRHPLTVAAVNAMAKFFLKQPRSFWDTIYARAARLAGTIDQFFVDEDIAIRMPYFSSQMYVRVAEEEKYGGLLFCQLREKGVFILEGLPCYLTASHSEEDVDFVIDAFKESVADMRSGGFFGGPSGGGICLGKSLGPSRQIEREPVVAPVTMAQQEIWLASHLDPEASCAYNEATTLRLRGAVDVEALGQALNGVVARHEALRAYISEDGAQIQFLNQLEVPLPVEDLRSATDVEREARIQALKDREVTQPFDLAQGPLIRAQLARLADEDSLLFLTTHHVVCDGWAYNLLVEELGSLYSARVRGEIPQLPAPMPFSRYAKAVARRVTDSVEKDYWRKVVNPLPEPLDLPLDRPYPTTRSFAGSTERRCVSATIAKQIKRTGARQKCTAYHTLLGAFEVLFAKLTGQSEFFVGQPTAGQAHCENSNLIGHCVNFLPLRASVNLDGSFAEHLLGVRQRVMESTEHQEFTYGELLPELDLPRSSGRMPLVELVLTRDIRVDAEGVFAGLSTEFHPSPNRFVNFPIFCNIIDGSEGFIIDCDYQTDLFDAETIQRWLGYLETLFVRLAETPEAPLREVSMIGADEEQRLLHEWNATERDLGPAACLHQLVRGTSDKVAVSQGETTLTYAEVEAEANALAQRLQALGVGPDDLVGVFLDRDPHTVAALLGVLKAGGAYVPLDPGFPEERLRLMIDDASPKALVTTETLAARLPTPSVEVPVLCLDGARSEVPVHSAVAPENLAYVIYTSGSTGKPKGVQIEHRAIVNFLRSMGETPGLDSEAVLLAVTTLCFDISLLELFLPLISGARVEVVSRADAINPEALARLVDTCGATHLQATPVTWRLLHEIGWKPPKGFRMLCGGEPLPLDLAQALADTEGELWNLYGPTETTVWSTVAKVEAPVATVSIGRPIANTSLYLLDDDLRPVATGLPGRLFIGGHGLARGYANRPELTAERFIANPFPSALGKRIYDTGDLARYLPDGTLECLGRSDNQIKFNGYRIELGDIESAMRMHPGVGNAAVKLVEAEGNQQLLGYVVMEAGKALDEEALRTELKHRLPDYMIPGSFRVLDAFPLTPNRKIDRRALPEEPEPTRVEESRELAESVPAVTASAPVTARPSRDAIQEITAIWEDLLGRKDPGHRVNFFDVGGHSLLLLRLKNRLQETFQRPLDLALLFKHTTIESQARLLGVPASEASRPVASPAVEVVAEASARTKDIAVIGMSGRFPGAKNLDEFWANLCQGVESIRDLSEEELRHAGVPEALISDPNYVRRGALVPEAEAFDCRLFGISPREAELMDLQHRVFLEECYGALEDGGYDPSRYGGRIGVFAGSGMVQPVDLGSVLPSDYYAALTGGQPDYLTTRVAYRLNLRGPSLTVQTGCSTSLVALHVAYQNLLADECEMALAGGVSLVPNQGAGYLYEEGMMLSPDGHCRAFDAQAQGTVFTQGAGVVLLKPLEAALRDGDPVRAVIRGSAINNDGAEKIGFTAPAIDGQAEVIERALAEQGIDPRSVGLLETHGTGTPLGDPIELAALNQAYCQQTDEVGFCRLGMLKSNVGHMDAAAGIGSFIKAVLALEKEEIPPVINFTEPNPKLNLERSPFFVDTAGVSWPSQTESDGAVRRAGVSSFGIGGTNAHVILEEAPRALSPTPSGRPWEILTFSAKTEDALEATATRGRAALAEREARWIPDVAYTLSVGRRAYRFREVNMCAPDGALGATFKGEAETERPVVFLFPGQGSAYHGMARGLYQSEQVFQEVVDRCDDVLHPLLGWRLAEALFADVETDWAATDRAQPALFVIEYGLAQLWESWGVRPDAMLGHSIGEYVAACLAGVFSLEDALRLVVERGRLMQAMEPGAMLAVPLGREAMQAFLENTEGGGRCEIAAENSPRLTVVAGEGGAMEALAETLRGAGHQARKLATSHAFHSAMMDEAARAFREIVASVERHPPQREYLSNLTGDWAVSERVTGVDYWCDHLRHTVRFSANVERISNDLGAVSCLELGPGNGLSTLVRQHGKGHHVVESLRHPKDTQSDEEVLAAAVGRFWVHGGTLDWQAYHGTERHRVSFPGYAMQRQPFVAPDAAKASGQASLPNPLDWTTWLFEERWRKVRPLPATAEARNKVTTLVLGETDRLQVDPTWEWRGLEDGERYLAAKAPGPEQCLRIIVDAATESVPVLTVAAFEAYQARVFDRVVALAKATGARGWREVDLVIVVPGAGEFGSRALGDLRAATLPGVALSLQQDLPAVRCRVIDLGPAWEADRFTQTVESVDYEPVLAVRDRGVYAPEAASWPSRERPTDSVADEPLWSGGGAVMITGGLGSIGLACASYLAKQADVPVVLVGRMRSQDGGSTGPAGPVLFQDLPDAVKAQAEEWRNQGASVSFYRADMSQAEDVSQLLETVEAQHGSLSGVIHAAGVVDTVPIDAYSAEKRRAIHAGKVHGAIHLAEALKGREPRFVLLISSISSLLGGVGYSAYASANAFLDSLAAQSDASSSETRWLALGLDAVAVKGEAAAHEMTPAQAAEMVGHHLRNVAAPSRLMVSKTPLAQRLDRWVYGMAQPQALPAEDASLAGDGEDQSVVERVQAIWEAVLKVDQVHPNDDFFELGGDSILAIPLFHRLTQAFGVALPIATLFQASTPSALAEKYQALLPQIEALTAHAVAPGGQEVPGVKPNAVMGTALSAADNQQASPFSDQLVIKMKDGDEGKPPIFFTHPGGGSVVFYHAILGHMSHGHPMYGIESPLLSQKRLDLTGMETVEKVAAGYTSLIRNVQPSGPYILAGYSFGGLVSLEMARILQDAGETVRLLIFDTPNPCAEFHRNKLSERLSYHWQKEGAVSEKLLSMSKRATFGVVNRIQNTMSRASARRLNAEERPSKSARILNFQILELYDILTEAYQPQPFQGDMNLFSAEDGGDKVVYDEHLGWRDLIRGDLRVTSVPGSHLTLFADENLPGFVSAVEQCLKSTEMVLHR